jgi:uncharacterized membrane protein
MATGLRDWRPVAVRMCASAPCSPFGAAMAGWRLASGIEATSSLEWHRWLGTIAALAVAGAALTTAGARDRSAFALWVYRITLFWSAALVAVTGHLGGLLVWRADFVTTR